MMNLKIYYPAIDRAQAKISGVTLEPSLVDIVSEKLFLEISPFVFFLLLTIAQGLILIFASIFIDVIFLGLLSLTQVTSLIYVFLRGGAP